MQPVATPCCCWPGHATSQGSRSFGGSFARRACCAGLVGKAVSSARICCAWHPRRACWRMRVALLRWTLGGTWWRRRGLSTAWAGWCWTHTQRCELHRGACASVSAARLLHGRLHRAPTCGVARLRLLADFCASWQASAPLCGPLRPGLGPSVVQVFDVRMAPRMLASVPFAAGPSLLRFHPRISGTLLLASASGVFTLADAQGLSREY